VSKETTKRRRRERRAAEAAALARPPPAPPVDDVPPVDPTVRAPCRAPSQTAGLSPPWPKGTSGNPGGSSQRQRITNAFHRVLDRAGLEDSVATTVVAMALGQQLGDRNPSIEWMRLLIDRVDGPLDRRESKDDVAPASPEEADNVLSAEVAERVLRAANEEDEDDTAAASPSYEPRALDSTLKKA
jgi:hypothetical protein